MKKQFTQRLPQFHFSDFPLPFSWFLLVFCELSVLITVFKIYRKILKKSLCSRIWSGIDGFVDFSASTQHRSYCTNDKCKEVGVNYMENNRSEIHSIWQFFMPWQPPSTPYTLIFPLDLQHLSSWSFRFYEYGFPWPSVWKSYGKPWMSLNKNN